MSDRTCGACGESFATLTKLRLHEKDECPQRETYAEIDMDSPDRGLQGAEELLTCRNCAAVDENADYEQTASVADGDYHLIVEFTCRVCGFENENRVVGEGIDASRLTQLPPHLQPDDGDQR